MTYVNPESPRRRLLMMERLWTYRTAKDWLRATYPPAVARLDTSDICRLWRREMAAAKCHPPYR